MNVELPPDFADLLVALVEAGAEFLLVGGYAVAHYGHPRATKDIDVFVRAERGNAERVVEALASFDAPLRALGIGVQDFDRKGQTVQLGVAPYLWRRLTRRGSALEGTPARRPGRGFALRPGRRR